MFCLFIKYFFSGPGLFLKSLQVYFSLKTEKSYQELDFIMTFKWPW